MAAVKPKRRYQSVHQLETGIVSAVTLTPRPRVRVKFPDRGNMQSYWLRMLRTNAQSNKDFWMPDVGEQVECLMDEQFRNGLVLGASDNDVDTPPPGMTLDKRHTTYKDGATFEYDRHTHVLDFKAQDAAEFKHDATAHAFSAALPNNSSITITLNGTTVYIDPGGDVIVTSAGEINLNANSDVNINAARDVNVNANTQIFLAGGGPAVARVGDSTTCPAGTGHITSGSSKVQSG